MRWLIRCKGITFGVTMASFSKNIDKMWILTWKRTISLTLRLCFLVAEVIDRIGFMVWLPQNHDFPPYDQIYIAFLNNINTNHGGMVVTGLTRWLSPHIPRRWRTHRPWISRWQDAPNASSAAVLPYASPSMPCGWSVGPTAAGKVCRSHGLKTAAMGIAAAKCR